MTQDFNMKDPQVSLDQSRVRRENTTILSCKTEVEPNKYTISKGKKCLYTIPFIISNT